MERFTTIVVDPPWKVSRPTGWGRRDLNHQPQPYPTMTVEQIVALPVADLALPTSYLFLWTVNAFVEQSYEVARRWGFRPVTLLTWVKQPRGMGPGGLFATTTEFLLYCRRGSAADGRKRASNTSWFDWPRRAQSQKPEELQDLVESILPGPYLELFARRKRPGWYAWGNEIESDISLDTK